MPAAGELIALWHISALVIGGLIALSSADDLFVDAWYWGRELYRFLVVRRRYKPLPESALHERDQQPLAIMIPAWQEDTVIAAMIENTVTGLDYDDYHIFVGTYPNDAATIAEVERARRRHRRVTRVELPHPGPTCKADCLNHILAAIRRHEDMAGEVFAGVIMHDCEDVLHPLELKFFNYLLPRKDLIQLPVISMERGLSELVAGTYMDEFAEWHAKDLVVRESLAGFVPSAGVGTCFSHRAVEALRNGAGEPFSTSTLTEDYDIGARMAAKGLRTIIARYPVTYRLQRNGWRGGKPHETTVRLPLCVREYFPNTFRASLRQKARWMIGITLQGWVQLGWTKSARANYFLLRDRKGLISAPLTVAAYGLIAGYLLLGWTVGWERLTFPEAWAGVAAVIFGFNAVALVLRVTQRMYFVNRVYGWRQALLSAPRMIAGVAVSFAATIRAVRVYAYASVTGRPIGWDKTAHEFPSGATLLLERRRLGDILKGWEAVTEQQLDEALAQQDAMPRPLGRILVSKGWLDDETLAEAIAVQAELPRASVTEAAVLKHRDLGPEDLWIRIRAAPIGVEGGAPVLAVASPLGDVAQREVKRALGRTPVQRIAREGEIAASLRLLRGGAFAGGPPLIGDILVMAGLADPDAVARALDAYRPDRDGRIGEHLLASGVVNRRTLDAALAVQARWGVQ